MDIKPQAVVFDMDGVVVDSEPWWLVAMDACFVEAGVQLTPADFGATTGLRLDQVIQYWYEHQDFGTKDPKELEKEIYQKVLELVTQNSDLMPGLREVLNGLRAAEIPIGLASSSSQALIDGILRHFDIAEYYDVVMSAEGLPLGKPHPEVFIETAKQLGVTDPLQTIVIEDSINGIIAAKAARMKCIAMPDPQKKERMQYALADQIISSLTELKNEWWQPLLVYVP